MAIHMRVPGDPGPQAHRVEAAAEVEETTHHVADGAVGAEILGAAQPLADEAEELGDELAVRRPVRNGDLPDSRREPHGEGGEGEDGKADAPILAEQERDDAGDEDGVAEDVDREAGEEVRQASRRRRRFARSAGPGCGPCGTSRRETGRDASRSRRRALVADHATVSPT